MMNQKGFSLIELLIVVAIILIIAAIAIPSLMRARIASNESAMVGDIRTVISAEATFQSSASNYGLLTCLNTPNACFPGAGTVFMIDTVLSTGGAKNGYARSFEGGAAVTVPNANSLIDGYVYGGTPQSTGRTGLKGFGGDYTGIICWTNTGVFPATSGNGQLVQPCANTLGV